MTTGVLRTQTQLTRLPPCKGWNRTLESQEQRYQLPTIKKLSRKLLWLLSLCCLLPIFWILIPSVALMIWQHQKIYVLFPLLCQVHLLPKAFLVEWSFWDLCASFHTFCCRGSIHSRQAVSGMPSHLVMKQVSTGNWGRRGRTSTSLLGLTPTPCTFPSVRHLFLFSALFLSQSWQPFVMTWSVQLA